MRITAGRFHNLESYQVAPRHSSHSNVAGAVGLDGKEPVRLHAGDRGLQIGQPVIAARHGRSVTSCRFTRLTAASKHGSGRL